ncbi:MAG: HAMP domain-containing histidine kinase [Kurthia sp.]|nr:HAMP domain-containing histidine kinase [Candidatus Kurthia equi]
MKWRLARRFLFSTVLIVIIVLFVNTILLVGYLMWQTLSDREGVKTEGIETTAAAFYKNITVEDNKPVVTKEGQNILKTHHAWVQILDANGRQVNSYFAPSTLMTSYTPVEIVQMYKRQEVNGDTTVFIGEAGKFSYFFGVEDPGLTRIVYSMNFSSIFQLGTKILILFLIVDILIAILIGFIFGKHLTKPMYHLISGINNLKNKKYQILPSKKGIYREVFENMNDLSDALKSVESERQKLDKMRNQWISNISHDMKTPLSSIQGYAELIKDSSTTITQVELQQYSQIIENKSKYMNDLLNDLNLTTKLRSGTRPLDKKNLDATNFLKEIIIEILNDPQYENRQIDFEVENEPLHLEADAKLLKRALNNFIYNALVHNEEDVHIIVSIAKGYPQGIDFFVPEKLSTNPTIIRISDNGRGIPLNEQKNIFERYYRGTNTSDTAGTGLGMAISHDVIVAHDGFLHLVSDENIGTTIYIFLP